MTYRTRIAALVCALVMLVVCACTPREIADVIAARRTECAFIDGPTITNLQRAGHVVDFGRSPSDVATWRVDGVDVFNGATQEDDDFNACPPSDRPDILAAIRSAQP